MVQAASATIAVLKVKGTINPVLVDYIKRGITKAETDHSIACIIQLDTPGGLETSMREIVQAIVNAKVPVVVYVSPSGGRAASAGVFITMAAHIAAMAPNTNIGAAHPVAIDTTGGTGTSTTMDEKIINDSVAYIKSIAEAHGRNVEWAEKAVRERTAQYLKDCVDWATDFGTDNIYLVTPTNRSDIPDPVKAVEWLSDSLTKACDYAKSAGVKICIEHSPGKLVGEARYLNQLIKECKIENFGALIDIGHLNMTKEDAMDTIMKTDRLYHVHFDNNDGKNDIHTPLDVGTLPMGEVVKFIKALKQKKYDGYYSIELLNLQNPIKTLKENIAILKDIYNNA